MRNHSSFQANYLERQNDLDDSKAVSLGGHPLPDTPDGEDWGDQEAPVKVKAERVVDLSVDELSIHPWRLILKGLHLRSDITALAILVVGVLLAAIVVSFLILNW